MGSANRILTNFGKILFITLIFGFLISAGTTASQGTILGSRNLINLDKILTEPSIPAFDIREPVAKPIYLNLTPSPPITAASAIVIDRNTFAPLFEKDIKIRRTPASTTKIVTAIVVLENTDLSEIVTVPADVNEKAPGSRMGLFPNQLISRENLLWGMLLVSGNDAAYTLATTFPEGYIKFIEKMNELAIRLNLKDSSFSNPIGFDDSNHFTTAYDLAIITDYALKNQLFRQIVGTRGKLVFSQDYKPIKYVLKNTNQLLGKVPGVAGVKTGWTNLSGGILTTSVKRDSHEIIVVVMQSSQREDDTIKLIEWVYENYKW